MKALPICFAVVLLALSCNPRTKKEPGLPTTDVLQNRPPLRPKPLMELPLGSIRPEGWLRQQMERMASGMTGHLDEWYPEVVGDRNGWLGGDGDGWERGVYWIDGLLPLAWQLDNDSLKAKAMRWVEWSLEHQEPTGYFGPVPFRTPPDPEPGLQRGNRRDWWPKMVMLKVLQQYYEVSGDERVIELMRSYFRYQLEELPRTPLDHWSFWANRRGGDNLMMVYWLYSRTGDAFLLELADLLHEQTFPWSTVFMNEEGDRTANLDHLYPYNTGNRYPYDMDLIGRLSTSQLQAYHCVNFAQGVKEPVIRSQQDSDPVLPASVKKALADMARFHGQPQGMYGGDEPLHGPDPTQGIELCSVVELMYSLETMIAVTGDPAYMDLLEWIAYNALPTQVNDDFTARQYFQQANQVMLTRHRHNFYEEDHHGQTDIVYGLLTGYPCCTCNLHQGWPKLTSHLWYATDSGGLAAVVYGPSVLSTTVAGGRKVEIREETRYPFSDRIRFEFSLEEATSFPLDLRIPRWCERPELEINGEKADIRPSGGMVRIEREWAAGDVLELILPMVVELERGVENSVSVKRGPLLYVLRIGEEWKAVKNPDRFGDFWEVRPTDPWNVGLTEMAVLDPAAGFSFVDRVAEGSADPLEYPWTLEQAPVALQSTGKIIPDWTLYREMAGPLPHSLPLKHLQDQAPENITLIPYGASTLRVTCFPVVR
ncbi:MAG: glycoside hydrolase family 127 protein [Bacteroidales bacterium]